MSALQNQANRDSDKQQSAAHDFLDNMVSPREQDPMIERFDFSDGRELFAKANEEKSGDQLAGIAARSERERVAAKCKLADLTLGEVLRRPLIDPSEDDVTRLILDTFDQEAFRPIGSMTVGEFREVLLDDGTTDTQIQQLQKAIIPECIWLSDGQSVPGR